MNTVDFIMTKIVKVVDNRRYRDLNIEAASYDAATNVNITAFADAVKFFNNIGMTVLENGVENNDTQNIAIVIDDRYEKLTIEHVFKYRCSRLGLIQAKETLQHWTHAGVITVKAICDAVYNMPALQFKYWVKESSNDPVQFLEVRLREINALMSVNNLPVIKPLERGISPRAIKITHKKLGGYTGLVALLKEYFDQTLPCQMNKCLTCKNCKYDSDLNRICKYVHPVESLSVDEIAKLYKSVEISDNVMVSEYLPLPKQTCEFYKGR
ncbi:MAG: hypothetical protein IKA36_07230 [Clostridia bacterium]|nr:hypothetical protein [Clostridia bacterium]